MSLIPQQHRRTLAGYRMPAEWEPHQATYLVWPHNPDTWPGKFELIPAAYAKLVAAIAEFEPVRMLVEDDAAAEQARALIRREASADAFARVETIAIPTNDSWIRDHGPIFVNRLSHRGEGPAQIALDFGFNSWGEKYGPYDLDDLVPRRLAESYGFQVIEPGIVLEGGSIDVNGSGSLLTTESCLLNPNRSRNLTRADVEEYLRVYLGITNVLWLGEGIAGDDTDGHVDDLARFVAPNTIVTVVEDDPVDENYRPLRDNLGRLREMRDEHGQPFRIETMPMPPPIYWDGQRLPASYANFLIVNGGVVMPTFDCPADAIANAKLAALFPGRRIAGVPSTDLVLGLGSVHCLTQQHPR